MNLKCFTIAAAAALLIAGIGGTSPASAFTLVQSLGASPVATDIVQFTCPVGTVSARGQIRDLFPVAVPHVRIGLFKAGQMPTVQAAQEGLSLVVLRAGGPGTYWAVMSKDLLGFENYQATVNCYNAAGAILPAFGVGITQNQ